MDSEVYSFALKSTLGEIPNICPDVKGAFIFREDGEIVAVDMKTDEQTIVQFIDKLDPLLEGTKTLGGNLETLVLECENGQLNVSWINKFYLAMITSKKADKAYVDTIRRVLIPTIIRLIEQLKPTCDNIRVDTEEDALSPSNRDSDFEEPEQDDESETADELPAEDVTENVENTLENTETESNAVAEEKTNDASIEPPVNQFIVENIGGLLVPADTVRIENNVLAKWQESYPHARLDQVEIETFGGKSVTCKVKALKDSKFEGKGVVQMPEKIQNTLEIKKGELVRVKPLVI